MAAGERVIGYRRATCIFDHCEQQCGNDDRGRTARKPSSRPGASDRTGVHRVLRHRGRNRGLGRSGAEAAVRVGGSAGRAAVAATAWRGVHALVAGRPAATATARPAGATGRRPARRAGRRGPGSGSAAESSAAGSGRRPAAAPGAEAAPSAGLPVAGSRRPEAAGRSASVPTAAPPARLLGPAGPWQAVGGPVRAAASTALPANGASMLMRDARVPCSCSPRSAVRGPVG